MRTAMVAAILLLAVSTNMVRGQQQATSDILPAPQPVADSSAQAQPGDSATGVTPMTGIPADAQAAPGCCSSGCDGCAHTDCGYISGEYLLWFYRHPPLPALVSGGFPAGAGVLGQSGTTVLYDDEVPSEPRSGARITLGYWLDDCKSSAVELTGFFLGWRDDNFHTALQDTTVVARPFLNTATGLESAFPVAFPRVVLGDMLASNRNIMYGVEANWLNRLCAQKCEQVSLCGCCLGCYQVDWLAGFRYVNFQERLDLTDSSAFAPGGALYPPGLAAFAPLAGETVGLADSFDTRSQFYGPQIGLDAVVYQGSWAFELRGKLAAGISEDAVSALGDTQLVTASGSALPVAPGGLYTTGASGRVNRVEVAVLPEATFNIAYRPSEHLAAYVGYNILYWTSVLRAGDQVNQAVNPAQLPAFGGSANPAAPSTVQFHTTDMWVQGLNVGVEFTW